MHVTNLTTLPSLLPLTTLTVLLLTAEWSVDTKAARASINHAEKLATCPSIQFLELSVKPPLRKPFPHQASQNHQLVTNLTNDPPYLPHLRVLSNTEHGNLIHNYQDSFDAPAIAFFVSSLCAQPFPDISSRDSVSVSLRNGFKAAIMVDDQPFTSSSRLVIDTFSTRAGWVVGFAGPEEVIFRERHNAHSPGVVLVDRVRDAYQTVALRHIDKPALQTTAHGFEKRVKKPIAEVTEHALKYFREPRGWRQCFENTTPMGLDAWMGAHSAYEAESFLWVFVTAPWCGFCQRALPDFERFVGIVKRVRGVYAVMVNDSALPAFLDSRVDGFPTVLMLRERGSCWTSVAEYLGERSVHAMVNMHYGNVERALRLAMVDV